MKRTFTIAFLLLCCCAAAFSQRNGIIRGIVFDTIANQPVAGATITLLQKKDSSLISFTMTDNSGRFELRNLANADYRLLITHVNYHPANKFIALSDNNKTVELGNITVLDKNKVLDEVLVTAEAPPVTVLGDTVQYNAGSFRTQPNASVEQLLKKLPGVQVDKDGNIKAQGEKVNRVLVDGKEFFGNDPKVATRNLPADAIDKVQVYDKQSDQAQLTGFDDGNYEKTINLKLKKDKKKGVFGKATAGGGTDNHYEGKFNVNSFKGARQMSAIGMGNNTNSEGFSFLDVLNFTGELNRLRQGGGGMININTNDANSPFAGGSGNGIRTTWAGGLNYNNIIGNKTDFTSNYFYNRSNPKLESQTDRTYFLPDSSYSSKQHSFSNNLNNNHRVNLSADIRLDTFNSIKISPSFSYQDTRNMSSSTYQTFSKEGNKSNDGFSNNDAHNNGYNFRNDLLYRKKFPLRGRTFSLSLQTSLNKSNGDGDQQSVNKFYNTSGLFHTDSIFQQNKTINDLWGYNAKVVYTEPIFRRSLLEFSIGKSNTKSTSEKTTYDYDNNSKLYDRINDQLTNNFENTYGYTTGGIRMRTQYKKFNYAIGVNWQQANLEGKIISGTKDSIITKQFTNLLPNLRFQYNFNRFRNISINYSASTNQPTASQLQPIPDITDPLNIKNGNPDLKQEYSHTVQAHFTSVNPYSGKNLFGFLTLRETQNKIVNYDVVNSLGIKTTKPVNVNGAYSVTGDISIGLPVRFLKGNINIGSSVSYNKGKQFINTAANNIGALQVGPNLRLDMNLTQKIDLAVTSSLNYNHTTYSLQAGLNSEYFSQTYGAEFNWELPKNFFLGTDFDYTINDQRLSGGFNTKVPLWNASFSRQFLKFNRGELKLRVNDLLNKNIGISHSSNQNYVEDGRTIVLQRFFLLSFTYSLTKNGLSSNGGGMKIITH